MKKLKKDTFKTLFAFVLTISVPALVKLLAARLSLKTNSLLCILLDMNTGTVFLTAMLCMIILFRNVSDLVRSFFHNLRAAFHMRAFKILLGICLLLVAVPQFFPFSNRFSELQINGRHPFRMQYNFALLRDAFSGETEVLTTDAKYVTILSDRYSFHRENYYNPVPRLSHYLCFGENRIYLYSNALQPYLSVCQQNDKQIEIVYHKHSGVVETVDGIRICDSSALLNSTHAILQKAAEEQAAQEQAEKEAEEEHLEVFSAFFQSEGENYEEIVRSLTERGLENTYDTIYISTQYFEPGEIALFDNTQNVIYVCRDNDGEDMVKVPPLPLYGSLTEITKILDDAGIKWTYHCFGCRGNQEDYDHSNCILHTVHCSPGTPIPKDYVFWFSLQHVG